MVGQPFGRLVFAIAQGVGGSCCSAWGIAPIGAPSFQFHKDWGGHDSAPNSTLLQDAGWNLTDGSIVLFEHVLPEGTQADYVLCDRQGRLMAALEAKRATTDPATA